MSKGTKRWKSARAVKSLPGQTVGSKTARGIRGGSKSKSQDLPTESISLSYGKLKFEYSQ